VIQAPSRRRSITIRNALAASAAALLILCSPGAARAQAGAQFEEATAQWINKSDPESDARLDAITAKAMEDFIAASEGAKHKGKRKR
jgi:hypothetical protein